jgi:hypothetical protein
LKTCGKCGEHKGYEDFHKNIRKPDGCQSYCKPCMKIRNREYYLATPERNPQRQESRLRMIDQGRKYVDAHLAYNHCVDCGYSDRRALQFDHVRGEKVLAVSEMVCRGTSVDTIKAEIAKCEVRCANCHSIVTHQRRLVVV